MKFDEAKVIVTGGSKGIGKQTALELVRAGAKVVVTARGRTVLAQAAEEIGAEYVVADVSDETSVKRLFEASIEKLGGLNVVINNAAFGYFSPVAEIDSAKFDSMMRTNLYGAMYVGRESAKHFIAQSSGNIVNISSTAGGSGFAGGTAYCASKFALKGMTECWRAELRKHNVRVMLVNPSEVQTDFGVTAGFERRAGNPSKLVAEDIANTILSLLSLHDRAFVPETSVWATNPKQ